MSSADLSRLTAIVHTCDRPHSIDRLVKSLGWLHPQLKILIADDSKKPRSVAGADLVKVAPGVGVSACRNALLARVRTPFFLLLTDDLEVTRNSGVERLIDVAASNKLDIAAGELIRCQRRLVVFTRRTPEPAHATFDFGPDCLTLTPGARPGVAGALPCDVTHNFFVGRTDRIRAIGGWDPQLQIDERVEFFFRACRYGLKVAVCPESIAWRWADQAAAARRDRDFMGLAVAKMGVSQMTDAEGRTHHAALTRAA